MPQTNGSVFSSYTAAPTPSAFGGRQLFTAIDLKTLGEDKDPGLLNTLLIGLDFAGLSAPVVVVINVATKLPGFLGRMLGRIKGVGDDVVELAVTRGGADPVRVGQAGEQAVRQSFNIGNKVRLDVNGRLRIPDGLTGDVLTEIKNVKKLSYTRQLRDFSDFAAGGAGVPSRRFDLFVRPTTKLSGPLQEAVREGIIRLRYIP